MRIVTIATLLAAVALPLAGVSAQTGGSAQSRAYVEAAGGSDAFELMEAHTALAESRDPAVLAFARRMIQDHGATSAALRDAATRSGIAPPSGIVGAAQSPFLAALQSQRGAEFDRAYWRQQALAHRAALVTQQGYAARGDAPALRQAAAAAVPMIQAHLAEAESRAAAAQ